jgi:hypothetical protein
MTPQENLNDIMDKRILKTKMYSFNEVREMFELERQRLKEEIEKISSFNHIEGISYPKSFQTLKQEVLALLEKKKC